MWDRKDLLSIDQLERSDIDQILGYAETLEPYSGPGDKLYICRGEILYRAFFEPSTRTYESFGVAMHMLDGDVEGFRQPTGTSMEKNETKEDTLRALDSLFDIIVIRDDKEGSVAHYANILDIPVINAGDGSNEHPSQTLLDLRTIEKEVGTLDELDVVFVGDLMNGRTVHSLIKGLRKYNRNQVYGFSPRGLELPEYLRGTDYQEIQFDDIYDINPQVIYVTRIQKERIEGEELREQFDAEKKFYEINSERLTQLPATTRIMHPLPCIGEIDDKAFEDSRVIPYKQVRHGIETRMAILAMMLGHVPELMEMEKTKAR